MKAGDFLGGTADGGKLQWEFFLGSEVSGLGFEEVNIEPHFGPGEFFAIVDLAGGGAGDGLSIETEGIETDRFGKVGGPFVVEFLGDEGDLGESEDFLGPHDRVESAQPRVIANDLVGRNAGGNEGVFHVLRLIVFMNVVVPGDDETLSFTFTPKGGGGFDAILKIEIRAALDCFVAAKNENNAGLGEIGRLIIQFPFARRDRSAVGPCNEGKSHQGKNESEEEKAEKKFANFDHGFSILCVFLHICWLRWS